MTKITNFQKKIIKQTLKLSVFETKLLVLLLLNKSVKRVIGEHQGRLLQKNTAIIKNILNTGFFDYLRYEGGEFLFKIKEPYKNVLKNAHFDFEKFLLLKKLSSQTLYFIFSFYARTGYFKFNQLALIELFGNKSSTYNKYQYLLRDKLKPAFAELKKVRAFKLYRSTLDYRGFYASYKPLKTLYFGSEKEKSNYLSLKEYGVYHSVARALSREKLLKKADIKNFHSVVVAQENQKKGRPRSVTAVFVTKLRRVVDARASTERLAALSLLKQKEKAEQFVLMDSPMVRKKFAELSKVKNLKIGNGPLAKFLN